MTKTNHYIRRSSERNISELCLNMIMLFGIKLDKRDGIQIDMNTYREITTICNNSINRCINNKGVNYV